MQALASALEIMCEKLYLPLAATSTTTTNHHHHQQHQHTSTTSYAYNNNNGNGNGNSNEYIHNFVSIFRRLQFTFSLVLLHGSAIGSPHEQLSISSQYATQHKVPVRIILATSIA